MLPNTLKDLTCLCAADHKGFVFVGTKKGAILILDVATDPLKPPILLSPLLNMEFAITSIKLSSNKELIAATDVFKYLTLWNIEDKKVYIYIYILYIYRLLETHLDTHPRSVIVLGTPKGKGQSHAVVIITYISGT